jgi:hypothetical protein
MIMAKKKEVNKLTLEMIQCEKDGFGVNYGRWKARQSPTKIEPKTDMPEGWKKCAWCGTWFKPKSYRPQKYCEISCQITARDFRLKDKKAQYMREYRKRVEANGQ